MWTLLALAFQQDDLSRTLDDLAKRDLKIFERADGKFGIGRMAGSAGVSGDHGLWVSTDTDMRSIDRFLVGNRRDRFTKDNFRVQVAPVALIRPPGPARSDFTKDSVSKLVKASFGKSFDKVIQTGNWMVKGVPIKAKADCLKCHTSAKSGDVLGYLVYAAKRPSTR